jgi:adenylate cyclase
VTLKVDAIRECLEGVIPGTMATAAADGTPNVTYISQVQYVDPEHVALSYQFFNKTRQNIMANPRAVLIVTSPLTIAQYRMRIAYLRTETAGPLFESMKARLAGIASHTGMSGVFRLLGADVYRVHEIERVPGESQAPAHPARNLLSMLRICSERLKACHDLERLLAEILACLDRQFGISHAMILLHDEPHARLYTVASHGYAESGIGSEIPLGQGVIGVAARERTPIRISHMNSEYAYSRAIRNNFAGSDLAEACETEIPLPGLSGPGSQLAVPVTAGERLLGVLYVESPHDLRFTYDDEDALVSLANQVGMAMQLLQGAADGGDDAGMAALAPHGAPAAQSSAASLLMPATGKPLQVRHYRGNGSIFLGDAYLIKGVAGAIFWTLLHDHVAKQRSEFTNRELRLDSRIRLPDVSDNLEARLILLSRRLAERNAPVRIEKTGRGRFRLCVDCPLSLAEE